MYNLAPETEENILWQLFGPFGAVQNVKVIEIPHLLTELTLSWILGLLLCSGDPRLADEQVQGLWLRHHDQLRGGSCRHSGNFFLDLAFFAQLFCFVYIRFYNFLLISNASQFQSLNGYTLGNRVLQVSFKTNNRKV